MAYQDWQIPTGFEFLADPPKEKEPSADKDNRRKRRPPRPPKPVPEGNTTIIYQGDNYYMSGGGANNYAGLVTINNNLSLLDKNIRVLDNKLGVVVNKLDRVIDRISIQRGVKKGTAAKGGYPGHPDLEYARDPFTGETMVRVLKPNGKIGSWRLAQEHYGSKKRAGGGDGGYTPGVPRVGSEKHATLMTILHGMARGGKPKPYSEGGATLLSNVDFSAGPGPIGSPNDFRTFEESDDNMPSMRPASEFQQKVAQQQYEASETPIAELTVSTKKEFKKIDSKLNDMAVQLANLSNMMLMVLAALGVSNLPGPGGRGAARKGGMLKRAASVLTRRATMIPLAIGGALGLSSLMSPEAMAGDMSGTGDESGKGGGFGMGEAAIAGVGGYFMYRTIRNTATKYTSTAERKRMAEKAYKRYLKRAGTAVIAQNATKWQRFIVYLQAAKPALYRRIGMRLAAMGVLATVPVGGWVAAGIYLGLNAVLIAELIGLWRSFESLTPEEQSMWDKFKAKLADIFLPEPAAASVENPLTPGEQPTPATTVSPPGKQESTESTEGTNEIGKRLGLNGRVTSPMGKRNDPITGKPSTHSGIDFAGREGDPVQAYSDGTVVLAKNDGGHGNRVILDHGEYRTSYSHLSAIDVKQGDTVKAGQVVGKIGSTGYSTGPHLHFEMGPEITDQGKVIGYAKRDPNQFIAEQAEKLSGTIKGSGAGGGQSMAENLTPVGRTSDLSTAGKQREQMISGSPSVTVMQPIVQGGPTIMGGNNTPPQSLPKAFLQPSDSVMTSFNRDRWALA